MVNKEIIIDGIDVSNCVYLPYCEDRQGNCGNNPNCYYKQLQRKIIECEELKNKVSKLEHASILYLGMLDTLIRDWYTKDIFKSNIIKELREHYENSIQYCIDDKHFIILKENKYSELIKENDTLQDFRQLVREKFPFDDSDITDDEFIKYLQEYIDYDSLMLKTLMELTNILNIDWTVHGVDCDVIKNECRKLKGKQNEKN